MVKLKLDNPTAIFDIFSISHPPFSHICEFDLYIKYVTPLNNSDANHTLSPIANKLPSTRLPIQPQILNGSLGYKLCRL